MLVENHEVVGFGEKSVVFCGFWVSVWASEEIVKNQLARAQLRYEGKQASLPRPRDREDRQESGLLRDLLGGDLPRSRRAGHTSGRKSSVTW